MIWMWNEWQRSANTDHQKTNERATADQFTTAHLLLFLFHSFKCDLPTFLLEVSCRQTSTPVLRKMTPATPNSLVDWRIENHVGCTNMELESAGNLNQRFVSLYKKLQYGYVYYALYMNIHIWSFFVFYQYVCLHNKHLEIKRNVVSHFDRSHCTWNRRSPIHFSKPRLAELIVSQPMKCFICVNDWQAETLSLQI